MTIDKQHHARLHMYALNFEHSYQYWATRLSSVHISIHQCLLLVQLVAVLSNLPCSTCKWTHVPHLHHCISKVGEERLCIVAVCNNKIVKWPPIVELLIRVQKPSPLQQRLVVVVTKPVGALPVNSSRIVITTAPRTIVFPVGGDKGVDVGPIIEMLSEEGAAGHANGVGS